MTLTLAVLKAWLASFGDCANLDKKPLITFLNKSSLTLKE